MAKCTKCKGTGEVEISLPERDLKGRRTGYMIKTTDKCKTCRGTGQS